MPAKKLDLKGWPEVFVPAVPPAAVAYAALPDMTLVEHLGELRHAGWSCWIAQVPGVDGRSLDAWRADPAYQSRRTVMRAPTPRDIRAWLDTLPVLSAAELEAERQAQQVAA